MIPDWLNLTQLSGNSGVTTISVEVPYNFSFTDRTAIMTVATTHTNMSETVDVTQSGQQDTGGTDYSEQYFTIEVTSGSNIRLRLIDKNFYYSKNNANWRKAPSAITATNGDIIRVKGDYNELTSGITGTKFVLSATSSTARYCKVYGNILSLIYSDNFVNHSQFDEQFINRSGKLPVFTELRVTDAENLILPSTTLYKNCYDGMFNNCTDLTKPPKILPAINLAPYCYQSMFKGCVSITKSPELPATTLFKRCYYDMFYNCNRLTTAPALPATTLATSCYEGMFYGCTSLTTAPELPATTLAIGCYKQMFGGCTSLTTAPELPANYVYTSCYEGMFSGCTSLTTAPALPATDGYYSPNNCYRYMFQGCTSLTTAPLISLKKLYVGAVAFMFDGCSRLNYIKCLAEEYVNDLGSGVIYRQYWVRGVASSGTFVKKSGIEWESGVNGIPTNWTVQEV